MSVAPSELEAQVGRGAVIGVGVGVVLFFVGVTAMCLALGVPVAGSFGLGAFTAVTGGIGFGGMIGAVMAANREERRRSEHS